MEACGSLFQIPFPNTSDLHVLPWGPFIPSTQDWSPTPDLGFRPQPCDVYHCCCGGNSAGHDYRGSFRHPNQAKEAEDPEVHDEKAAAGNRGEVV